MAVSELSEGVREIDDDSDYNSEVTLSDCILVQPAKLFHQK